MGNVVDNNTKRNIFLGGSTLAIIIGSFISWQLGLLLAFILLVLNVELGYLPSIEIIPVNQRKWLFRFVVFGILVTSIFGCYLIIKHPAKELYQTLNLRIYYFLLLSSLTGLYLWARHFAVNPKNTKQKTAKTKIEKKLDWRQPARYLPALLIVLLFIGLAARGLGQFITVDESKWIYSRIPSVVTAMKDLNFADMLISDKPGVIPSYLIAPSIALWGNQEIVTQGSDVVFELITLRAPMLAFNAIFLLAIMYQIWWITKKWQVAILSGILIATTPFLIAMTGIINPDSVLWSVGFAAILQFIIAFETSARRQFILAGAFLALALSAKFTAATIYIFSLLYLIWKLLDEPKLKPAEITKYIYLLMLSWLTSIFGLALIYPYTWYHFNEVLRSSFGSLLLSVSSPLALAFLVILLWINQERPKLLTHIIKFSTDPIHIAFNWGKWLAGFAIAITILLSLSLGSEQFLNLLPAGRITTLFYSLQVWALGLPLTLMFGWLTYLLWPFNKVTLKTWEKGLISFVLVYALGTIVKDLNNSIRYQIMLLPIFALFAGRLVWGLRGYWQKIALVFTIIYCGFVALTPYPWVYTNELASNADLNWHWGYGGYEMAKLLNRQTKHGDKIVGDMQGVNIFLRSDLTYSSLNPNFKYSNFYDMEIVDLPKIIGEADYVVLNSRGESVIVEQNKWADSQASQPLVTDEIITKIQELYSLPRQSELCLNGNQTQCWWLADISNFDFNSNTDEN